MALAFWLIKITATTLGETGGDAVSMTLGFGYAGGAAIFFAIFLIAVFAQIRAQRFHPFIYWFAIVATTTVGTTMADYVDRSLGIGYAGGSTILLLLLLGSLALWRFTLGTVSVKQIVSPKAEMFYWITILFSNTLGTALGDWLADDTPLGYEGGALLFGGVLALIVMVYFYTRVSRTLLFWVAFILTRPLGATLGDLFTKPLDHGGLDLSRISSSLVLAGFMVGAILFTTPRKKRQRVAVRMAWSGRHH